MSFSDGRKVHGPTPTEIFAQARAKLSEFYPNYATNYLTKFEDCTKTEDIVDVLEQEVKKFKAFREDRWKPVRAKLRPVVAILFQIVNVTKGASSHIPGGSSIFGGLSVLLAATQAQSEKYDILEKLFAKFDYFLLRFNHLYGSENRSPRHLLDEVSTRMLAHFFHCIAVSITFIQKGRFCHWLWGVFGLPDEIKVELERMEALTSGEGLAMNSEILINGEDIKQILIDQQIKDWIAAPDPSQERYTALSQRLKTEDGETPYFTGSWILQDDTFVNWKSWKGSPILWLYGPSYQHPHLAGTGKTVICATIIDHLQTIGATVEFFFNNRSSDSRKQSMVGLVSSFLEQLAATHRNRNEALRELHRIHSKGDLQSPSSFASEAQIKCLRDMLEVDGPVFLLVDALDEHPKYDKDLNGEIRDRAKLLELLISLSDYLTVRLLVTSRDEPDIRRALERRGPAQLNIGNALQQQNDIKTYIALRLASEEPFMEWSQDYVDKIDLVWEKLGKETMFRLVSLQLDSLKKNVLPKDVQATLDALPKTLDEMYANILKELESTPNTFVTVTRAFEIIYSAQRSFTIEELAEVFAMDFFSGGRERLMAINRLKNPEREVLEICSSAFIQLKFEERRDWEGHWDSPGVWKERLATVQFSHASVIDFLQSSVMSPFRLRQDQALITLCRLSISALVYMMEHPNDIHPLQSYISHHLLGDIGQAAELGLLDEIKDLLDLISLDVEATCTLVVCCIHWSNVKTPLAWASFLGLTDYVKWILKVDSIYADTTALHVAAARGDCDVLECLIAHGGHISEDNRDCTAVGHATQDGHLNAVRLLAQNGAYIGPCQTGPSNPIDTAAEQNFFQIAEVLLKYGAKVRPRHDLPSPLDNAAMDGHLEVANVLINYILETHAPDDSFNSALHLAAARGRLSMVQLLVARLPQLVNTQIHNNLTPLHAILRALHKPENRVPIMKFLLSHGADPLMTDRKGQTPLHIATFRRDLEMVRLLVEHNEAALYVKDVEGRCPLQIAIRRGKQDIVEYLSSKYKSKEISDEKDNSIGDENDSEVYLISESK